MNKPHATETEPPLPQARGITGERDSQLGFCGRDVAINIKPFGSNLLLPVLATPEAAQKFNMVFMNMESDCDTTFKTGYAQSRA